MNFSRFFIYRPIFTIMVTLIVVLIGVIALIRLPIDLMPDISSPTMTVSTTYTGAGPEEIEELITRPIEEVVSAVPGVEEVTSNSREGNSSVRVTFTWGTDLSEAANDIRERLDSLTNRLPELADRPVLRKFDLASFPIVILGVESDLPPIEMKMFIDDQIKNRIEKIPGVASLDTLGGLTREVQVNLLFDKINALNIPFNQIISQLNKSNIQSPAGPIQKGNLEIIMRTPGEYKSIEEIKNTLVMIKEGAPIYIRDIAEVKDTSQKVTNIVRVNGKPGVRLAIRKQSGSNTVEVADEVIKEVANINRDFKQVKLFTLVDTSKYIKTAIENVFSSIVYGGILSILVLLFFLRNLKTTFVISISIPISIIATFSLMYFGGLTLNIMTLGGLALGVGMLVDNSIVVLENIYRIKEQGLSSEEASIQGTKEVSAAIIASTLTTLAVFFPLIFVRGISGIMYQQLAYVVGFSLICSLVTALTIVPMITAKVLKGKNVKSGFSDTDKKTIFSMLEDGYKDSLNYFMKHKSIMIISIISLFSVSIYLSKYIGSEFMPSADESEVRVNTEMEVGTQLSINDEKFRKVEEIVNKEVPEAISVLSEIGGSGGFGGPSGSYASQMRIYLDSQTKRKRSSEKIAADLRKPLSNIPGMVVRTRQGTGLFIFRIVSGGNSDKIQIRIAGYDFQTGKKLADEVASKLEKIAGITDVQLSKSEPNPEELVIVDRQKASDVNITVSDVGNSLQTILSGLKAGAFRDNGKEYDILVKVKDSEQIPLEQLLSVNLISSTGNNITLKNIVKTVQETGPVSIERYNQERIIGVAADVTGRDMGEVISDIRKMISEIETPSDFNITLGGDYEEQQKSFYDLVLTFVLSILLVYMIMAAQYESLKHPFVIMFSVPLAAIGVITTLIITDTTFNIQTFIGCIMLGGIVVNNAIILVDQINQLKDSGLDLNESIVEAGRRRLRPILMTTLTTVLGLLPLALGIGEGAEAQAPMARTVIGGMVSSTFFTLFLIPVLYYIFEILFKSKKQNEA